MRHGVNLGALLVVLSGCTEEPLTRSLRIVTGHESDTFSAAPAVTKVRIEATTASGASFVAEATPGGSFDLGDVPVEEPLGVEVTGTTAEGVVVVRGRSLAGLVPGAFASNDIPVFVQRVGTFARPPGELVRAHENAPATVLGERYLATSGGTAAASAEGDANVQLGDFYDLVAWNGAVTAALPMAARTLIGRLDGMLVLGDKSGSFITASGTITAAPLPNGLNSFADVAGGAVVEAPSGTSFVVGATRASGVTKAVLSMTSDGTLAAYTLNEAREGAAAVWAPGIGLVVVGGSASGPGLEVLLEGQTTFIAKDFPSDATKGAAAVVGLNGALALVGGAAVDGLSAPTRSFDPACSVGCTTKEIPAAALPVALGSMSAFSLGAGRVLGVGRETEGASLLRVFEIDLGAATVTEHMLREPRSGAAVLPAPNGTLAIIGGALPDGSPALHVETFFP